VRLKSYYAGTVEVAIALARQELGEDIMLIHSRRTSPEFAHLGAYEVVFAITPQQPVKPTSSTEPSTAVCQDFGGVKKELMALASSLEVDGRDAPYESISRLLREEGVHPDLIFELVCELRTRMLYAKPSNMNLFPLLAQAMENRIQTASISLDAAALPKIIAVIGPPGCGKTTTLVKLAAKYGVHSRRPSILISSDNYRIGASDQLRSFAAILGLAFDTALTPPALGQLIEEHKSKDLILIDTPGISNKEFNRNDELAVFLSSRQDVEKHLILSASMKNADLSYVVDSYRVFAPNRLLFTKLDETATQGAIWSEAVRTGLPLSYFAAGQMIPEDIETASKTQLIDSILKQERKPRSATAGM